MSISGENVVYVTGQCPACGGPVQFGEPPDHWLWDCKTSGCKYEAPADSRSVMSSGWSLRDPYETAAWLDGVPEPLPTAVRIDVVHDSDLGTIVRATDPVTGASVFGVDSS